MKKQTVESLFKLPSMVNCYLAAGGKGILREIKRIDILETPYPEVERFLEPNEFIFTSFWNSKDDKSLRIKLVESMIEHKCAGIGIMAGLNLNGLIDEEIIQLGNKHSFPVISISTNARWSDIIKEFYEFHKVNKSNGSFETIDAYNLLNCVENFYTYKNAKLLCDDIAGVLKMPITIMTNNDTFFSEYGFSGYVTEKIITKINGVRAVDNFSHNTGITIYLNNTQYILAYYGYNSVFATIIDRAQIENSRVNMFHRMASFVIAHLDELHGNSQQKFDTGAISDNKRYYLFFIRKKNIQKTISSLKDRYIIYEINKELNYVICLMEQEKLEREAIYSEYSKVIDITNPDCFIFSELFYNIESIHILANTLTGQINELFLLKGIFLVSEIPLIYMLTIAPYSYKKSIYDFNSQFLKYNEDILFIDTLRLFIVLKSINNVAELLNIHPNTVKYRILKVVSSEMLYSTNITADIWNLEFLIPLEMLKIETFD